MWRRIITSSAIVFLLTVCGGHATAPCDACADGPVDASVEPYAFDGGCTNGDPCALPRDISGFQPPAFVPPRGPVMACSPSQVQGYWDNCGDPAATMSACSGWRTANTTCDACIESNVSDPAWGPVVVYADRIALDLAGCVSMQNDTSCAVAIEWVDSCTHAACGGRVACSPDALDSVAFAKCSADATACGCKTYDDARIQRCSASSAYAKCHPYADFKSGVFLLVPMFCGG